jgi:hypothetical protein
MLWVVDVRLVACMACRLQEERVSVLTLAKSQSPLTSSWHLHVLGRDEAHVMAESCELTPNMMGAGAGLPADQAGWNVGQALRELGPGELEAQHDGAALILADKVEAVLAQIDTQGGNGGRERRP